MVRWIVTAVVVGAVALLAWYFVERDAAPQEGAPPASLTYFRASEDMIFVISPKPGETVTGTIIVKGFARGLWYFEATFPVEVLSAAGATLVQSYATAEGEWMTENFVPFTATVAPKTTYVGPATIVLRKDNPSGDPSHDALLSFPVVIE